MVRGVDTGGAHVKGRGHLPPGTRPPGIHRHPHQDERVTVVTGRVCVQVGKDVRKYGPGESVFLPVACGTTSGCWEMNRPVSMDAARAISNAHDWFEVNSGWAPPDDDELAEWLDDGVCRCPDDCLVRPEGWCPHGLASWWLVLRALDDEG